jgi:hypothetical protein
LVLLRKDKSLVVIKQADSLLFNIVINDIFYFIEHGTLYNYADDNTLSYADQDYNTLINVLEKESSILIEWFNFNCMQTNCCEALRQIFFFICLSKFS